jgi:hypothetical protein
LRQHIWAVAVGALVVCASQSSLIQAQAQESSQRISLTIQTVPHLRGVRFSLDGRYFRSDGHGLAQVTLPQAGTYELRVWPPKTRPAGTLLSFARWSDGVARAGRNISMNSSRHLEVGFAMQNRVFTELIDTEGISIDRTRAAWTTLVDDTGREFVLRTGLLRWLPGGRLDSSGDGLTMRLIPYEIRGVTIQDSDVGVIRPRLFFPARQEVLRVRLSSGPLRLEVDDALFDSTANSRVHVRYADGSVRRHRLDADGRLQLELAPPGKYSVTAEDSGFLVTIPFGTSEPNNLHLLLLTPLDIVAAVLSGFLLIVALLLSSKVWLQRASGPVRLVTLGRRHLQPAAFLFIVLSVAGVILLPLDEGAWVARASAVVTPVRAPEERNSWLPPYKLSLISRELIVPTLREVVSSDRFAVETLKDPRLSDAERRATEVEVVASPANAVITVTARSTEARVAELMAQDALDRGRHYIDSLDRLFVLKPVRRSARRATPVRNVVIGKAIALIVAFGTLALMILRWGATRLHARLGTSSPAGTPSRRW